MNKNCAAANLYDSLPFCKGNPTLPGIRPEVYGIPKSQIISYPKLPSPGDEGATMKSIATYSGDFTLAADSSFIRIDVLTLASSLKSESQGDQPSKTFLNTASLKYAGNNEAATGFCRLVNSDDFLFVIRQRDGKFRVLGNEMFETDVKPSQDSGMAVTDASGTMLEATVTDICPAPFYVGKLKLEDGMLDCSTGEIEAAA